MQILIRFFCVLFGSDSVQHFGQTCDITLLEKCKHVEKLIKIMSI